jgi:hypothetical protein
MAEPRTAAQRAAQEAFLWCRAHGAHIEWLDRERMVCRISFRGWPDGRKITVIAPSFVEAYKELREELADQAADGRCQSDSS